MQIYFYAKSGHQIGLEATKKCAAVASELKDFEPVLCTSDFRAGAFAKELLGIKKYVNIDVIRNLYNIMNKNDILIYHTDETSDIMKEGINSYCSVVYDIQELGDIFYDSNLYNQDSKTTISKAIFFGDDDYNNIFLQAVENSSKHNIDLLMGHYFFLGNEKIFKDYFTNVIDEEEYVQTISQTKYLLTASVQSAIESLASGNYPVLFIREDKNYNKELIKKLQLPVIEATSLDEIVLEFEKIIDSYPKIDIPAKSSLTQMKDEISNKIETYKSLTDGK
ncbi:MAG: hypothetical protein ACQERD_07225 [Campylobacterota bacterium]